MDAMTSTPDGQLEADPRWYQALTLTERLAHDSPSTASFLTDENRQKASMQRLKRWKEQGNFKDDELFAQRLLFDKMAEQDLVTLLGEPVETMFQHYPYETKPPWLQDLTAALETDPPGNDSSAPLAARTASPFVMPFQPLLTIGINKIMAGMQDLTQNALPHPFDPATILPVLIANVTKQIEYAITRPLILELHIARLQERLTGMSGEERMADFLRQLSQPEQLRAFLLEYPVLARYLITMIERWASYSLEFLRHLCIDWHDLCTTFAQGSDPGSLQEIQDNSGDKHNRGRSVLLLRFSSGLRLVYKPRSLRLDRHFQELIAWINEHGIAQQLRAINVIDRDSYGWCEFVTAQSCASEGAVERFYERLGSYLAILYLLDATDFHAENLIAVGEHPIPIDLESLFHPRLVKETNSTNSGVLSTVLRIGLLPVRDFRGKEGQGVDISGMAGGQKGQRTPMPIPVVRDVGTDQMRIDSDYIEMPTSQNRPLLNDEQVEVHRYEQNIAHGFTETYRLFIAHRAELQDYLLPRFAQDEVRLVVRPTQAYMTYLQGSLHPDNLQDALARDQALDHLWDMVPFQPYLKQFIRIEYADLLAGDIPLFHTSPASTAIFSSTGERLEAHCIEPALTFVQQRLSQMGADDLARQLWIIQASLATTVIGISEKRRVPLREEAPQITKQQLMKGACAIGDRLSTIALRGEEGQVNWLGLDTITDEQQGTLHWALEIADSNLYNGTPGIVLFLAYLGAITGEAGYTQLARAALVTLQQQVMFLKQTGDTLQIGAFAGLGSLIYLFSHLEALWQDPSCRLMREDILSLIEKRIEQDQRLDIIAGSAGCLASLLSLYAIAPSQRILTAALRCGDHLLAHAQETEHGTCWQTAPKQPPLAGFSHGAAGIAYSLAKLSASSGETHFLPAIQGALAYERSLFSQEEKNWPFLYTENETITSRMQTTWCHGAPGIGLGRLGLMQLINDPLIAQEIEAAIETTVTSGFGSNQSICHGNLGNLETLLVGAQMLNRSDYYEQVGHISAMIIDSIERCGWVTGIPMGVETPGLMVGLSGMGYQLLRLAEPERVPSVLLLAPPV
jgi:type 2 lantibiotic biosynthesis protein LanM